MTFSWERNVSFFLVCAFLSYQGKVESLCESSSCQVLSQQLCQFIKWELGTIHTTYLIRYDAIWLDTHQTCTHRSKPRYLVGYSVGAWCGAGNVVETIGHGSILHDVTGVDDVRACGRYLYLDLVAITCSLGSQAHLGEQLGDFLS